MRKECLHLLDLQVRYLHAIDNVRKECNHVIVTHCHVGHDPLERNLLRRVVLVLLPPAQKLMPKLRNLALWSERIL